jgi:hypothetical protein
MTYSKSTATSFLEEIPAAVHAFLWGIHGDARLSQAGREAYLD